MSFDAAAVTAGLVYSVGKGAIEGKYRRYIEATSPLQITHSVDLDSALRTAEPGANRWDYGLGLSQGNTHFAVWIEPHGAASAREVDNMLLKLRWLKDKLKLAQWSDLNRLTGVTQTRRIPQYWWLAPGTVCFRAGSKESRKLAQEGMKMPVKKVVLA